MKVVVQSSGLHLRIRRVKSKSSSFFKNSHKDFVYFHILSSSFSKAHKCGKVIPQEFYNPSYF